MDENRFINTMLWTVMILWAAGIGVFYFFTSDRWKEDSTPSLSKLSVSKTFERMAKVSPSFHPPTHSTPSSEKTTGLADRSPRMPAATTAPTKEVPFVISSAPTENQLDRTTERESPPAPTPTYPGASTELVAESTKETSLNTPAPEPIQVIINETTEPNGSFSTAQKITEGVVAGKRGSRDDRSDFYKVRAIGDTMILKLEPSLRDNNHRFVIRVYNEEERSIEKSPGKNNSTLTFAVTHQAIYYIGMDLRSAPIETPPYKLNVHFN